MTARQTTSRERLHQRLAGRLAEHLIVALDVSSADAALCLVQDLRGPVGSAFPAGPGGAFKVGLELFTAAGPRLVERLVEQGERVFLDLKLHDIPSTVRAAAREAARLGVFMLDVHASGGRKM